MPNTSKWVEIDPIKEKLIELLKGANAELQKQPGAKVWGDLADILIANGVTIQEWIPVSERLPENGGSYLVFSSKSKTVFTAHYWLGDRWSNRANGQFITHWMHLPEPPKGE